MKITENHIEITAKSVKELGIGKFIEIADAWTTAENNNLSGWNWTPRHNEENGEEYAFTVLVHDENKDKDNRDLGRNFSWSLSGKVYFFEAGYPAGLLQKLQQA